MRFLLSVLHVVKNAPASEVCFASGGSPSVKTMSGAAPFCTPTGGLNENRFVYSVLY